MTARSGSATSFQAISRIWAEQLRASRQSRNTQKQYRRLAILLALLVIQITPAHAGTVDALRLEQEHYFFGKMLVTFCPTAIRMENNGSMKFKLVAKAPDWRIFVFRDDDRICYQESLNDFVQTGGFVSEMLVGTRFRQVYPETAKPFDYQGTRAMRAGFGSKVLEWLPQFAGPIEKIAYAAYKLPTNGGYPLKYWGLRRGKDILTQMDESGHTMHFLSAEKLSKVRVSTDLFDPPQGYRKAPSMAEVLVSKAKRNNESEDFQEIFKIGDEKKRL